MILQGKPPFTFDITLHLTIFRRAIPPRFFKNTTKARAVTKDSPKKYDNFRQLCGQKGIRISAPKAAIPKMTAAQFFDSLICAK